MPHTDEQLEELDSILMDLPWENEGMLLSEFDGFVAGLIVCPDMIPPSKWLPVVWGTQAITPFEDVEEAERVINAVMAYYNRVASVLSSDEEAYEAILDEDTRTQETLWEAWVDGFEKAMRLRPDAWEQIVESGDKEAASSISMILTMKQISEGESDLDEDAIARIDEIAAEIIPDLVIALNRWTKGRALWGNANANWAPARSQKVGRNELCPCGSGQKYKRCCGAN